VDISPTVIIPAQAIDVVVPTQRNPSAAEELAETTGEPVERFTPDDELPLPDPDDPESGPDQERSWRSYVSVAVMSCQRSNWSSESSACPWRSRSQ